MTTMQYVIEIMSTLKVSKSHLKGKITFKRLYDKQNIIFMVISNEAK